MKVKEIMTRNVATCPSTATVAEAARLMWDNDCGIIPVTDGEGRLCGVITDRDACMAGLTQDLPFSRIPVTQCMSRTVYDCREDQNVDVVQSLMRDHQVRRIPVVDKESRVMGIVSLNDLALRSPNSKAAGARTLARELPETLRAICVRTPPQTGARSSMEADA